MTDAGAIADPWQEVERLNEQVERQKRALTLPGGGRVETLPVVVPAEKLTEADLVFIQAYVAHRDPVRALKFAGLTDDRFSNEAVAAAMMERPEIKEAVSLVGRAARRLKTFDVTKESGLADLEWIFDEAMRVRDFQAALGAKKLQFQLNNLLIERREVVHSRPVTELSTAQLQQIIEGEAEEVHE